MTRPIAPFLPHAPPMILLDHLLTWDDDSVTAEVTVHRTSRFVDQDHRIPAHIGLEWMAQACAAYAGLQAHTDNRPVTVGFLLGTRDFDGDQPWFAIGETATVLARRVFLEGGMAVFDCAIHVGGIERAHARLNVFQPDESDRGEASA